MSLASHISELKSLQDDELKEHIRKRRMKKKAAQLLPFLSLSLSRMMSQKSTPGKEEGRGKELSFSHF